MKFCNSAAHGGTKVHLIRRLCNLSLTDYYAWSSLVKAFYFITSIWLLNTN